MLAGLPGPGDAAVDGLGGVGIEEQVGALADHGAHREPSGCENRLG